jgi:hypothetical protein
MMVLDLEMGQVKESILQKIVRLSKLLIQQCTFVIALLLVYAISLSSVDAIHGFYLFGCAYFAIVTDRNRIHRWRWLVVYSCLVTITMYIGSGLFGYEINSNCQSSNETSVTCLIGLDTKPYDQEEGQINEPNMLNVNFLPQLAILLFVTLQQLNYSAILRASRRSKSFSSTRSSMNYVPNEIRSFFRIASQVAELIIPVLILAMSLVFALAPPYVILLPTLLFSLLCYSLSHFSHFIHLFQLTLLTYFDSPYPLTPLTSPNHFTHILPNHTQIKCCWCHVSTHIFRGTFSTISKESNKSNETFTQISLCCSVCNLSCEIYHTILSIYYQDWK